MLTLGRGLGWGLCGALLAGASGCGPAVDGGGAGEGSGGADDSGSSSSGSEPGDPSRPTGAPSATSPATTEPSPTGDPDTSEPPDLPPMFPPDFPPDGSEIDGEYLVAFRTIIAEETPFQFVADVTVVDDVLDMTLVPLSLAPGSTDAPREELPEFAVSVNDILIGSDGTFMLELPDTFLPGQANPITSSDVVADLRIVGWFNGLRMCGNLSGQITVPANIDLTGSSLAGVPIEDGVLPPVENAACG